MGLISKTVLDGGRHVLGYTIYSFYINGLLSIYLSLSLSIYIYRVRERERERERESLCFSFIHFVLNVQNNS